MPFPVRGTLSPATHSTQSSAESSKSQENSRPVATPTSQSSNPALSPLSRHTIGDVQDVAKVFFSLTSGTSPKVVSQSNSDEMQKLRAKPMNPETITQLAALEHKYANAPGKATTADHIAARAGYLRNGAAHLAASHAALGDGGLRGAHDAGYLDEHIENLSSNFK